MTAILNHAARSAHEMAAQLDNNPNYAKTMATVFMANEENKLSPFRVYVTFEKTFGKDGMALLPKPGSEEFRIVDGKQVRNNLWDKFKTSKTNAAGNTVSVDDSYYAVAFRDSGPGMELARELEQLANWDKEENQFTKMTNKGDRDTERTRRANRKTLGIKMFKKAGELYHQIQAFAAIDTLRVAFVKDKEGNYKFTPEPIKVIDYSDPENGSLGNVKYFSVNGFCELDAEVIFAADDKWDAVTKPKPRAKGGNAGKNNAKGNKPEPKNVDEWTTTFFGMLNYMGKPGDVGKDSFYTKLLNKLTKDDSDELVLAIDRWDDVMDGIKTKLEDRTLRLKEKKVATQ